MRIEDSRMPQMFVFDFIHVCLVCSFKDAARFKKDVHTLTYFVFANLIFSGIS